METVIPWDGRDQEEQAELRYNAPLRAYNRHLEDENMRLKRLLRENGIPWNESVASHPGFLGRAGRRQSSRLSALDQDPAPRLPHLPVEVILRIMEHALVAEGTIVDPLCKLNPEHLTLVEAKRGAQVAIGFLSTCKAYNVEGRRIFWANNTFTFTTPEALRRFADLQYQYRKDIEYINLRIIARYYDDEKRTHRLGADYHRDITKSQNLRVIPRVRDQGRMSRHGFRSYTWTQVIDFLDALRPPFDPARARNGNLGPRPRLLPALSSLRIDFVNFPDYFLPMPETDLHDVAAHELGLTLNELMVTGLPCCETGEKARADLQGMVKDDGLFMCHAPSYIQHKRHLKPLRGYGGLTRVVRSWRKLDRQEKKKASRRAPLTAPEETGHPKSTWMKRKTLWKRVPVSRDAEDREWVEFDRNSGEACDELYYDSDEDVCPNCGVIHGMTDDDSVDSGDDDDDPSR